VHGGDACCRRGWDNAATTGQRRGGGGNSNYTDDELPFVREGAGEKGERTAFSETEVRLVPESGGVWIGSEEQVTGLMMYASWARGEIVLPRWKGVRKPGNGVTYSRITTVEKAKEGKQLDLHGGRKRKKSCTTRFIEEA